MPSILITGADRGLGLEWARQYAETGWRVLATCRQPEAAQELQALARRFPELSLHRLDVTDAAQVRSLAGALRGVALDILLNNAGIYLEKYAEPVLGLLGYDGWARTCAVNTLGAVRVTASCLDHVTRSEWRPVVAISSHMAPSPTSPRRAATITAPARPPSMPP
ncbi:MAG: SDR family NAD(P)-dependent oxidoreductase [Pseudomonadota bacterium]